MPLEIQIKPNAGSQNAGGVTVNLTGSLDTATAPELERQLAPVLAGPVKDLVFDLAQLKFISSAGLRVFSMARKQLKERAAKPRSSICSPRSRRFSRLSRRFRASRYSRTWRSWTVTWRPGSVRTRKTSNDQRSTNQTSIKGTQP